MCRRTTTQNARRRSCWRSAGGPLGGTPPTTSSLACRMLGTSCSFVWTALRSCDCSTSPSHHSPTSRFARRSFASASRASSTTVPLGSGTYNAQESRYGLAIASRGSMVIGATQPSSEWCILAGAPREPARTCWRCATPAPLRKEVTQRRSWLILCVQAAHFTRTSANSNCRADIS